MKITSLKTNYQINPLGIDLSKVTFSWKIEDSKGDNYQKIIIKIALDKNMKNIIYEDIIEADFNDYAYKPKFNFEAETTYFYTIEVITNALEKAISEVAFFEGGLKENKFCGNIIKAPFTREIVPLFYKEFSINLSKINKGRMYITALGLYEVYLNGKKVENNYLTPYWTDYRYQVEYQTYDVLPYLKDGLNKIHLIVGDGWYKGRLGYTNKGLLREFYGNEYLALMDLKLYEIDKINTIVTDESWIALKSPFVSSGIYDGEMFDARMIKDIVNFPKRQIVKAIKSDIKLNLVPMIGTHIKEKEVFKPKLIISSIGETILDFGQEISGFVRFKAKGNSGDRIILEYSEIMQDNKFYRDNLRSADAKYTLISNGEFIEVYPRFTFFGFRYVRVTNYKIDESNINDFEGVALYSDLEETGYIETSNSKLNRLFLNTKWGQKGNFLDVPTDCPQRDERLGWTGDAEIFSQTASFHMETAIFFRKYLKDMLYAQKEKAGATPYVCPDILTIGRIKNAEPEFDVTEDLWGECGASVWGDAASIIPYNMYLFYGNKELLAEEYENMKLWLEFIISMDKNHCQNSHLWTCGFHFGDWLSLDAKDKDDREGGTNKHFVASIFYYYTAKITSECAKVLDIDEDYNKYYDLAKQIKLAIRNKYLNKDLTLKINTQTAYAISIYFGIYEEGELSLIRDNFKELLDIHNDHLVTGFVGTAFLTYALTKVGLLDKAFKLLFNEDYPSWLYQVNMGATTIWERWNSVDENGSISGTKMNSLNHYAYGVISEWLYKDVCGLNPVISNPAFKLIEFKPHFSSKLNYINCRYYSISGKYEVKSKYLNESQVEVSLEVPFASSANIKVNEYYNIYLDGKKIEEDLIIKSGKYRFIYEIKN